MAAKEPCQYIAIPEINGEDTRAELQLRTYKASNGQIISAAHIHFVKGEMVTFEIFGDFNKILLRIKGRATQKTLDAQHAQAFTPESIDALKAEALAFYASKRKREAEQKHSFRIEIA